jgi:hypothetical protein
VELNLNSMLRIMIISLVVLLGVEIALRKFWGFHDMVLFQDDADVEYIAAPSQERYRFGNKIYYNNLSMRSAPIKNTDQCIVMGFGDSVLNGGTLIDQDSIATTRVENQLNSLGNNGFRFLNISAGSWGPDNCAAYLKNHGTMNATMIILMVSSHDAYDNMTFEKVVGVNSSYPDKQYPLALLEVAYKYALPRFKSLIGDVRNDDNLMINKNGDEFNTGFGYFRDYAKKLKVPLLVCLHAELAEVEMNEFNSQGKEIIQFCNKNAIKFISGLEIGENKTHFYDKIHLNSAGHKLWSNVMAKEILNTIKCLNEN